MDWDIFEKDLEPFGEFLEVVFSNANDESDMEKIVETLKVIIDTGKRQWIRRVLKRKK